MQDPNTLVSTVLDRVGHASLQHDALEDGWLQKQMPGGFGPVFAMWTKNPDHARRLPSRMYVFQHATSLGGMESLMEWRAMNDLKCDRRLLRVSCGLQDVEDMKADMLQAFESLV